MASKVSKDDERQARMKVCRDDCTQLVGRLLEDHVASPPEIASAIIATAIMIAFTAQDVGECDDINACISEVTDVVCRRVGEAVTRKKAGGN